MSDFVGSLKQVEQNSWQAAGLLSANGGRQMFDTVCKPRRFANEAAGQAFLAAWALTKSVLVLVEPGTPAGFRRILSARHILLGGGAHVLAPCPHQHRCPLLPPDWCHFAQRIERSRDHRILKSADLPYEDEKFSYLIAVRTAHFKEAAQSRILARPNRQSNSITLKLCQPTGAANLVSIQRRDKETFQSAKKKEWGNEI